MNCYQFLFQSDKIFTSFLLIYSRSYYQTTKKKKKSSFNHFLNKILRTWRQLYISQKFLRIGHYKLEVVLKNVSLN